MSVVINGTTGITFPSAAVQTDTALGYGQTWQNVAASRAIGTTYTNSTGRPILVSVSLAAVTPSGTANVSFSVDGTIVSKRQTSESQYTGWGALTNGMDVIVPAGSTYSVTNTTLTNSIVYWFELR